MDGSQIEEAFDILSQNQPLLSEQDNEWSTNGLNSTPSENLVSVTISTMTHTKRLIHAAVAPFLGLRLRRKRSTKQRTSWGNYQPCCKLQSQEDNAGGDDRRLGENRGGQVPQSRAEFLT